MLQRTTGSEERFIRLRASVALPVYDALLTKWNNSDCVQDQPRKIEGPSVPTAPPLVRQGRHGRVGWEASPFSPVSK